MGEAHHPRAFQHNIAQGSTLIHARPGEPEMNKLPTRRRLLHIAAAAPLFPVTWFSLLAPKCAAAAPTAKPNSRIRPSDPAWPSADRWSQLGQELGGALIKVQSPLTACLSAPATPACT